jgi:hypothetical protein
MTRRHNQSEQGQAVILLALGMVGLIAFMALAIDGGFALLQRRIAQNAVDGGALDGAYYLVTTDVSSRTETALLSNINEMVELHGIEDSDSTPGNEVNINVTVYYLDVDGNRLCSGNPAPCGSIPAEIRGLEVFDFKEFPTFFAGLIGR